jgi:hypothetical protein
MSGKFSRKHEQAISALLTQPTLAEAATTVGVGEATLRRWLQQESFQAADCPAAAGHHYSGHHAGGRHD